MNTPTRVGAGAAHRQVLERRLLAHADGVGRERVEDERGHRRVVVVGGTPASVRRRRPGRRRHHGRRVRIAQADVDADAAAARHARERAELLDDVVLAQLEVLRRQIGHRLAVLVPDDDVDQDGGRDRREVAAVLRRAGRGAIAGAALCAWGSAAAAPGRARRRRRIVGTSRHQPEGDSSGSRHGLPGGPTREARRCPARAPRPGSG